MRLFTLLFALLLLGSATPLRAQTAGELADADRAALDEAKEEMFELITTIYTDSSETARFQACRDLIRRLVVALDRPNSFNYDFGDVPGLSIMYPDDRSFRIFTWELYVDSDQYRHYGAIQLNTEELTLKPLLDRGDEWLENPENAVVKADNWLGYAVYDIVDAGTYRGKPYYFLLGYDSYSIYRRRKLLDVLHFGADGAPVFGLPVFTTYSESGLLLPDRSRIVLTYGAEATVALRHDTELGGIIYENLIMVPGSHDEGPVSMPDGSYHLLKPTEDGAWQEEEQIFTHKYEEAPREAAKPDGGRDLLGRPVVKPGGGGK